MNVALIPVRGSEDGLKIATGSGSSMDIPTGNSTVESLGLSGFSVTGGDIDLKAVDNALKSVQSLRTDLGADTNRVEYAAGYNTKASLELNGFRMDGEEDRVMNALQDIKAKQVLDQYQMMLQKKQEEDEEKKGQMFFA